MNIVTYEHCVRCGQIQEYTATNTGYIEHDVNDCFKALIEKVEALSHRVDELESKESARTLSERGPEYC